MLSHRSRDETPRLSECRIRTPRSDDRCPGRVAIYSHPCSLYPPPPSLSLPVLWSLRRLGLHHRARRRQPPRLYAPFTLVLTLSVWSRPTLPVPQVLPRVWTTWRTSQNIILARTKIHFHGVLSRRPFVRHRVS